MGEVMTKVRPIKLDVTLTFDENQLDLILAAVDDLVEVIKNDQS